MEAVQQLTTESLIERTFASLIGAMELCSIHLGDELGFYRLLADEGPANSAKMARLAGTNERYTREWLEQQAVSGFIAADDQPDNALRKYSLPDAFRDLFCDPVSPIGIVPMASIFVGAISPFARLADAFRTGNGISYADYGAVMHHAQAAFNRPQFHHQLATEWLTAMPDVVEKLRSPNGSRVADIGMGQGWSSIGIAREFPNARIDGFDLDEASVVSANVNAREAGLSDRVVFQARDAGDPGLAGAYDFALAIECVHDMSDPVAVLGAMRRLVGPGGTVLVVDEKVADAFTAPGSDVERLMYGFSVLHCLPVGMAEQPSVGTGTIIRERIMRDYIIAAGYEAIEILSIEHAFFRFYRLTA